MIAFLIFTFTGCSETTDKTYKSGFFEYVIVGKTGHFPKNKADQVVAIVRLTESGQEQETIDIARMIDGKEVWHIGYPIIKGLMAGNQSYPITSPNLKKMYIYDNIIGVNRTIPSSSSLYFSFTSSFVDTHKIETLGYVYKSTKLRIYDAYGGLVASSTVGEYPENAKIIIDTLQHNTKYYIVVNFIDYSAGSIQLCVSDCELGYKVDWYNIPRYYYDNVTMDLPTYFIHASFVNPTYFNPTTREITFEKIQCSWSITDPWLYPDYYLTMYLGENQSVLDFFCYDGILDYRNTYPNTWFYTSTLYDVTIQLSPNDWATYVTYGPMV